MIEQAQYPELRRIAYAMRQQDRDEIFALFPHDDAELIAYTAWKRSLYRWTANGQAAFGSMPMWPGVHSIWMFATDDFTAETSREMVRFIRRYLRVGMPTHAHRVECKSLATHTAAHRFIEALGLRREGPVPAYGKGREDFVTFARVEC